jgi:hypothetical protein
MFHDVRFFWGKKTHPTPAPIDWENKKANIRATSQSIHKKVMGQFFRKRTYMKVLKNRGKLVHRTAREM